MEAATHSPVDPARHVLLLGAPELVAGVLTTLDPHAIETPSLCAVDAEHDLLWQARAGGLEAAAFSTPSWRVRAMALWCGVDRGDGAFVRRAVEAARIDLVLFVPDERDLDADLAALQAARAAGGSRAIVLGAASDAAEAAARERLVRCGFDGNAAPVVRCDDGANWRRALDAALDALPVLRLAPEAQGAVLWPPDARFACVECGSAVTGALAAARRPVPSPFDGPVPEGMYLLEPAEPGPPPRVALNVNALWGPWLRENERFTSTSCGGWFSVGPNAECVRGHPVGRADAETGPVGLWLDPDRVRALPPFG